MLFQELGFALLTRGFSNMTKGDTLGGIPLARTWDQDGGVNAGSTTCPLPGVNSPTVA